MKNNTISSIIGLITIVIFSFSVLYPVFKYRDLIDENNPLTYTLCFFHTKYITQKPKEELIIFTLLLSFFILYLMTKRMSKNINAIPVILSLIFYFLSLRSCDRKFEIHYLLLFLFAFFTVFSFYCLKILNFSIVLYLVVFSTLLMIAQVGKKQKNEDEKFYLNLNLISKIFLSLLPIFLFAFYELKKENFDTNVSKKTIIIASSILILEGIFIFVFHSYNTELRFV